MNKEFDGAFRQLNPSQRQAVETIDGPLLVIAGPGTGKTQLIGTRVGYILKKADVDPANILLLTFTEAGVLQMRQRLERLVPEAAHKVHIGTYHGFGNDLIRHHPEYFEGLEGDPIDELAATTTIQAVIQALPHFNPLKAASYYPGELIDFISDAKQALLKPGDIKAVAKANLAFMQAASKGWRQQLDKLDRIAKGSAPVFEAILKDADKMPGMAKLPDDIKPLSQYLKDDLRQALEDFTTSGSTKPLTKWKNDWLEKDRQGRFIVAGKKANERLIAAAGIYEKYQQKLKTDRAFDYDDMILRVIEVLQDQPQFKYSLAERYQYIMLDEFQDTNPAQMRLIKLLTDHPVHEGRPNLLAVGDDDQAIYAFQGADHANMAHFAKYYRQVKVISLKQHYRAHQDLVDMAAKVAQQISVRLHHSFAGIEKILVAAGASAKRPPKLVAREFISDAAQYGWVASEIKRLISSGSPTSEIAVLAPKHKYLEALLPYLARHRLPVSYEKREDVLSEPKVRMLEQIARLLLALQSGNHQLADALVAEVISYDFWQVPTEVIWELVWRAKKQEQPLTSVLLQDARTKPVALFLLRLKDLVALASLEEMLDAMLGIGQMHQKLKLSMQSPFFEYYFGKESVKADPAGFTQLLSNLNLLRARLRNRQRREGSTTHLADFTAFIDESRLAGLNILNTNPYHQSQEAVNLLTAYGAKGREFRAVFVIGAQSEIWGGASRSRPNMIKLPANLAYITYAGMSDDERLRLFYVAITRAKTHLYITSYQQTMDGQRGRPLEFLGISQDGRGKVAAVLPAKYSRIVLDESGHIEPEVLEDYWNGRHLPSYQPALRSLLATRLDTYKLSATHLNKFIDITSAGPPDFFIYYLLGFPQAPSSTTAFGSAIHATLSWVGNQLGSSQKQPTNAQVLAYFSRKLEGGWLREDERRQLLARGKDALPIWLSQIAKGLSPTDKYEYNFASEGVLVGKARLTGKIDRLVFDHRSRKLTLVDIKTGKAFGKWPSNVKAHKFKQQLMFYKLLVEGSSSFRGYSVDKAIIEFAEADEGEIVRLEYAYNQKDLDDFKKLIGAVWHSAQSLKLPDVSSYPKSLKGIRQFEADLEKLNYFLPLAGAKNQVYRLTPITPPTRGPRM